MDDQEIEPKFPGRLSGVPDLSPYGLGGLRPPEPPATALQLEGQTSVERAARGKPGEVLLDGLSAIEKRLPTGGDAAIREHSCRMGKNKELCVHLSDPGCRQSGSHGVRSGSGLFGGLPEDPLHPPPSWAAGWRQPSNDWRRRKTLFHHYHLLGPHGGRSVRNRPLRPVPRRLAKSRGTRGSRPHAEDGGYRHGEQYRRVQVKVLVVSDAHVDAHPAGLSRFGGAAASPLRAWRSIPEIAEDEGPDLVVLAGDLVHSPRPVPEAVEVVADGVRSLARLAPVVVLPGNHEVVGLPERWRHPLSRLADIPRVTVVDSPTLLDYDGLALGVVPWPRDDGSEAPERAAAIEDSIRSLSDRVNGRPSLLVGHLLLDKAALGSVRGSDLAMTRLGAEPVIASSVIEDSAFDGAVLGHVHRYQRIGKTTYVGGTDRFDVSDAGLPKGVVVAEHDGGSSWSVRLVLTPARRWRVIEVDFAEDDVDDLLGDVSAGETVVLRYSGDRGRAAEVARALSERGAEVKSIPIPKAADDRPRHNVFVPSSIAEGIRAWAPGRFGGDVEALLKLVDELMAEGADK